MKLVITITFIFLIIVSCSNETAFNTNNSSIKGDKLISLTSIEKAGFEHIRPDFFRMLVTGKKLYLLNSEDKMIARFNGDTPERVYKAGGQGPGEFLNPISLFMIDTNTIAVFDSMKNKILFFDLDLNLKSEKSILHAIRKISKIKGNILAFGDFGEKTFAHFDDEFKVIGYYGDRNRKIPFDRIPPGAMYMGYLLSDGKAADTNWLHCFSECKIDIVDIISKKVILSLTWNHPSPPTQQLINKRQFYSCYYTGKHGKYYVVQNSFQKKRNVSVLDLLIFDDNGKLVAKYDFNHKILHRGTTESDSKIYYFNENDDIIEFDIERLNFEEI